MFLFFTKSVKSADSKTSFLWSDQSETTSFSKSTSVTGASVLVIPTLAQWSSIRCWAVSFRVLRSPCFDRKAANRSCRAVLADQRPVRSSTFSGSLMAPQNQQAAANKTHLSSSVHVDGSFRFMCPTSDLNRPPALFGRVQSPDLLMGHWCCLSKLSRCPFSRFHSGRNSGLRWQASWRYLPLRPSSGGFCEVAPIAFRVGLLGIEPRWPLKAVVLQTPSVTLPSTVPFGGIQFSQAV